MSFTSREYKVLEMDPCTAVSILETKYSNDGEAIKELNDIITNRKLTDIKDEFGRSKISKIEEFNTTDVYMRETINTSDIKNFDLILTREIQRLLDDPLKLIDYICIIIDDCLNHKSDQCLEVLLHNPYIERRLQNSWLPDITISQYYFKGIAHNIRNIKKMYFDNGVYNKMDHLDRQSFRCMVTESALRCCNTHVFEWCCKYLWRDIDYMKKQFEIQPYLNNDLLKWYFYLTDEIE